MNRRHNPIWELLKTTATIGVLALVCWALLAFAAYTVANTILDIKDHIAGQP